MEQGVTMIEAPDDLEKSSTTKAEDHEEQVEVPETTSTGAEETVEAPKEEETFEFEGEKLTREELKEALDARKNKSEWQKTNTQKAQEIAEQRRLLEQEQQALFLGKKLLERPELMQTVFQPEVKKNPSDELRDLYSKRPQDPYSQEYQQWELEKELKVAEIAERNAEQRAFQRLNQSAAMEHNRNLELSSWEEMKDRVSFDEFKAMSNWIVENLNAKDGKYAKNAYKIAYGQLFGDRLTAEAKVQGAKSAAEAIQKAKPASGDNGKRETDVTLSPEEREDAEVLERVKARRR